MSKQPSLNSLNTLLKRSPNQEVWVHVKVPICCCLCFLNLWWNVGKRAIYVWAFDYATLIFQDIYFLGGIPETQSELGAAQRSNGACLRQGSPTQWGLLDIREVVKKYFILGFRNIWRNWFSLIFQVVATGFLKIIFQFEQFAAKMY